MATLNGPYGPVTYQRKKIWKTDLASGKSRYRWINIPSEELSVIHAQIIDWVKDLYTRSISSTGGGECDNIVKHVERHVYSRFFYLLDIRNAFGSVTKCSLQELFQDNSYLWSLIEAYCFDSQTDALTMGFSTSNILFDMFACSKLDAPLQEYCAYNHILSSRYVDDLLLSSREVIGVKKRKSINRFIAGAGFQVAHRKTAIHDLKKEQSFHANSVGIRWVDDEEAQLFVPGYYRRRVRGAIHLAREGRCSPHVVHGLMSHVHLILSNERRFTDADRRLVDECRAFLAECRGV